MGLGRMALTAVSRTQSEQRVGTAEGQEKLTMRCSYISWATPWHACMCEWLCDICSRNVDFTAS